MLHDVLAANVCMYASFFLEDAASLVAIRSHVTSKVIPTARDKPAVSYPGFSHEKSVLILTMPKPRGPWWSKKFC